MSYGGWRVRDSSEIRNSYMKPKTKKNILKLCLLLALIAGFYAYKYFTKDITLSIENNSKINIHNLRIGFRGGEIKVSDLPSSKTLSFIIEPTGESDLTIQWQEEDSEIFEASDLTYIGGPKDGVYWGLHYTLIFQNDSAYLLQHDRKHTYVQSLKPKRIVPVLPDNPSDDRE